MADEGHEVVDLPVEDEAAIEVEEVVEPAAEVEEARLPVPAVIEPIAKKPTAEPQSARKPPRTVWHPFPLKRGLS